MQVYEAIAGQQHKEVHTERRALQIQKIKNASLIKLYRSKVATLDDPDLSLKLLLLICQDVPVDKEALASRRGRNAYVKHCVRYYQGLIRKIERSESKGFFRFF